MVLFVKRTFAVKVSNVGRTDQRATEERVENGREGGGLVQCLPELDQGVLWGTGHQQWLVNEKPIRNDWVLPTWNLESLGSLWTANSFRTDPDCQASGFSLPAGEPEFRGSHSHSRPPPSIANPLLWSGWAEATRQKQVELNHSSLSPALPIS